MFQQIRLPELLIIGAIILLLFGAKRLPDAARGLGRSLRIFKAETKGLADDPAQTPAVTDGAAAQGSALTEPAGEQSKDRAEG